MSFRFLLYLVVLTPLLVLSAVHGMGLQKVIRQYEASLEARDEGKAESVARELVGLFDRMDKITINLSWPVEIRHAVEAADNEVLYDWSTSFIDPIDTIFFVGANGIVLSRAPDEFRFGDSLASADYFLRTMELGVHRGVGVVDGQQSLMACRAVKKYDDVTLGAVCGAMHIDRPLLAELAHGLHAVLLYRGGPEPIASAGLRREIRRSIRLNVASRVVSLPNEFEMTFQEDTRQRELLSLKWSLFFWGAVAALVTAVAILLFLRWQFGPYNVLVNSILAYSMERMGLEELRCRLGGVRGKPGHEATRIADALIGMIDLIKANFARFEETNTHLKELVHVDELTGLRNRRAMDEALVLETHRTNRYGSPLCAVMLDIDHFRVINDTRGHPAGDTVLASVAAIMAENSRSTDILGRWGGEEFMVLCPGIKLAEAHAYAELLRERIAHAEFADGLRITASLGLAEHTRGEIPATLIARTDQALLRAKDSGRNRVRAAAEPQWVVEG